MFSRYREHCVSLCASLALAAGACSSSEPDPCASSLLVAACGAGCSGDSECADGTHCGADGVCTASCVEGSREYACGSGQQCQADGSCVPVAGDGGGSADSGTTGDGGGSADSGTTGDGGGSTGCGQVTLSGDPVTPNVVLVIDQSSSMNASFGNGGGTRWTVLKDTLLADDGLIADLQDVVRFGVVLYSARNDSGDGNNPPPPIGECPMLTTVDYAIENLDAIRATYGPADMIEDTPTGDALEAILDGLIADGSIDPDVLDRDGEPTVFILATDGEPDTCAELDPQNGQDEAVAAVERAYSLGVRTYVIAVAEENELSQDHLDDMANAGVGVGPGQPDAPSFRVNDQDGLRDALLGIVGAEVSCEVPFTTGRVTAEDFCVGAVTLNGEPLECNGDDGWTLLDAETVEVRGSACDELKRGGVVEAVFDCDSATLI